MPFTPFHFGVGLLAKSAAPRWMSFTVFTVTQVAIDVESLYHLVRVEWPVHRQAHSLLGGSVVGLVVAAGVIAARAWMPSRGKPTAGLAAEMGVIPVVVGGVLGGTSHSVLDAVVHSDVSPLWPLSDSHRLYGVVSSGSIHVFCVAAAAVGFTWLWLGPRRRRLVV